MIKDWKLLAKRVERAVVRRGRTEEEAQELLQEAWIRLSFYQNEHPVASPEAFVMRVALNLAINQHRYYACRPTEVLEEENVIPDDAPGPETILESREQLDRLSRCIDRLTPRTRTILLANRVDGMSYQEIAEREGISVSAVEKHIGKAMVQLTAWMDE